MSGIAKEAEVIMNLIELHLIRHYLTRMISQNVMGNAAIRDGLGILCYNYIWYLFLPTGWMGWG